MAVEPKTSKKKHDDPMHPGDVVRSARPWAMYFVGTPRLTKQSFKEEVDINNIIAKYAATGTLGHVNEQKPTYGYAPATDFRTALHQVMDAEEAFSALPAKVRARFANDPALMLEFVQDAQNADEARKLGLLREDRAEAQPEGAPAEQPDAGAPEGEEGAAAEAAA